MYEMCMDRKVCAKRYRMNGISGNYMEEEHMCF